MKKELSDRKLLVAVTVVLFGVTVIESVGSIGVIVIVVPLKLII